MNIATRAIHAVEARQYDGAMAIPIFQSSVFETESEERYQDIRYIRLGNTPNQLAVARTIAALEGTDDALVFSSGMAAISSTLLGLLSAGDHVLVQDNLYAGVPNLLDREAARFGIKYDTLDLKQPGQWDAKVLPSTKAVYVESISNPLLEVPAFDAIVAFARRHDLLAIIDNTFATPVNFRPSEHGFDLTVHSCSKYLNGHSDLVAGAIAGRRPLVDSVRRTLVQLGGSLSPFDCFLLQRSLKTLSLRVERQGENALAIANYLNRHERIDRVYYPGLGNDASHAQATRYFDGWGGVVSFVPTGSFEDVRRFFRHVKLISIAPSLGGVESSMTRPAATSHFCISAELRARMGVGDTLVRLSVGVESVDDLIADLDSGLRAVD